MNNILEEHGDAVKCALVSLIVMTFILASVKCMNSWLPIFDVGYYYHNDEAAIGYEKYKPVITVDYAVYVDKGSIFSVFDYVTVKDFDGADISHLASVEGTIDTSKEGLQYVRVSVKNEKGYSASKKINILVE
ncbi:MAG: DUF5011 domain-containing protein [Lachnospiraceae bacterium]|nr:DUF5011 domain-containing protein [Lachnospiraceae bacterium]